ncbi:hypothetical protein BU26DRAFT_279801 [Trematosphaeria pertusa]|uniref:F-box domain-containing protein n=1 Tax=Trematosphaeria pertusa TaxID=390896 RepID=A0A6A6IM15_9PLEO|nr:uncharacterized protein BU26DRAFT_279801 [Trematosphaeria pertusa]KAF2251287.1 hypothetical protein BU26DRAFT_279801 [Trematosphaeria pertusa]
MAALDGLPNELVDTIATNLAFEDINNLSLTCKSLRAATIPGIFRAINMTWDYRARTTPKLASLLRTLLERPDFIRHVKSISLYYRGFDFLLEDWEVEDELPPYTPALDSDDKKLFEEAINASRFARPEDWKQAIFGQRSLKAVVALLLFVCTNLDTLALDIDFLRSNTFLQEVLRHGSPTSQLCKAQRLPFQKLKRISVGCESGPETVYAQTLLPRDSFLLLFYLPQVHVLDLSLLPNHPITSWLEETGVPFFWPLPVEPVATNLTALRLIRTTAAPHKIDSLLKSTPNLTTLEYDYLSPSSQAPLDLVSLRSALDHVYLTLEHLVIDYEIFVDEEARDPEYLATVCRGSIGSLCDFTSLITLEICLPVLFGQVRPANAPSLAQVLPPNISAFTLTLIDDLFDHDAFAHWTNLALLDFIKAYLSGETIDGAHMNYMVDEEEVTWRRSAAPGWEAATPKLQKFTFDIRQRSGRYYDDWTWRNPENGLIKACELQGLQCILLNEDEDKLRRPRGLVF